jgi:hypothetical protein
MLITGVAEQDGAYSVRGVSVPEMRPCGACVLGIADHPQLRLVELDITDTLACRDVQAANAVNYPLPCVS